jgi:diacylglycerol kinase family enzyme
VSGSRAWSRPDAGAPRSEVAEVKPSARRRLAAFVALLVPAAIALLLALVLSRHAGVAVLAVALALIAIGASWYALTRRGLRRVAGAGLTGLAVAGLVVVLATHWHGVLVLIAALALVTLFGAAAAYALGRGVQAGPEGAPRAARARSAVLIINRKSGGGKAERYDLVGEARRRGIRPIVLEPGDDLKELAEQAIDSGAEVVGMAGGDGSQALVATVAAARGVAHVCIPAGTRNHFALDLGVDRDDVVGALDAYTEGTERRIDLARVNDNVFVNNASLGAYAKVVQSEAYRDAKLKTWTDMLPDLLGPEAEPIGLDFDGPDGHSYDDAPLVLVSNNPYQLTHLAGAGTRARLDSGELGIVAARVHDPHDVTTIVALELVGQIERYARLMGWSATEFEVRSKGPVEVGLDGEALILQPPLRFSSLPGALRVRVPASAGVAPAARAVALTGANIGELFDVAVGR